MAKLEKLEQRNVALPPSLCAFLERQARAEDRTVSGVIRRLIAEAARQEPPPAPRSTWPVRPATKLDTPEDVAVARARLAAFKGERDKLDAIRAPFLMPDLATRLGWLHNEIAVLSAELHRRQPTMEGVR